MLTLEAPQNMNQESYVCDLMRQEQEQLHEDSLMWGWSMTGMSARPNGVRILEVGKCGISLPTTSAFGR